MRYEVVIFGLADGAAVGTGARTPGVGPGAVGGQEDDGYSGFLAGKAGVGWDTARLAVRSDRIICLHSAEYAVSLALCCT